MSAVGFMPAIRSFIQGGVFLAGLVGESIPLASLVWLLVLLLTDPSGGKVYLEGQGDLISYYTFTPLKPCNDPSSGLFPVGVAGSLFEGGCDWASARHTC